MRPPADALRPLAEGAPGGWRSGPAMWHGAMVASDATPRDEEADEPG
jgi:hypothetical protein